MTQKQNNLVKIRADLIKSGLSVPLGRHFYYSSPSPLPYRWTKEDAFQVFYMGEWQDAFYIDWEVVE